MTSPTQHARMSISRDDDETVVSVEGAIDMTTSGSLREFLTEVDASGATTIVVDLSRASFLDSTGIGVLVGTATRVADRGAEIVLRAPSRQAARVLHITGLASRFRVVA